MFAAECQVAVVGVMVQLSSTPVHRIPQTFGVWTIQLQLWQSISCQTLLCDQCQLQPSHQLDFGTSSGAKGDMCL